MLHIVKGFDKTKEEILDQAFRFRHTAFVEEAGWTNLRRADGREIDQFDTEDTIHVIVAEDGVVKAYSRLNPTMKPHVLSEIYPHMASRGLVREPGAWEWSRMGTAKQARHDGLGWGGTIGHLVRCITYTAIKHDIDTLIWQAHPVWITRAMELGFNPEPLGLPEKIAGERVLAAKMEVHQGIFDRMDEIQVPAL